MNEILTKKTPADKGLDQVIACFQDPSRSYAVLDLELLNALGFRDSTPAILLTHIIGWFAPNKKGQYKTRIEREGKRWIAVPYKEWWSRCGVTADSAGKWLKELKKLGIIELKYWKWDGNKTTHITLNKDVLAEYTAKNLPGAHESATPELPKVPHRSPPKVQHRSPRLSVSGHRDCPCPVTALHASLQVNPPYPPVRGESVFSFLKVKVFNNFINRMWTDDLDLDNNTDTDHDNIQDTSLIIEPADLNSCAPVEEPTINPVEEPTYQQDTDPAASGSKKFLWNTFDKQELEEPCDSRWENRKRMARILQLNGYTLSPTGRPYLIETGGRVDSPRGKKVRIPASQGTILRLLRALGREGDWLTHLTLREAVAAYKTGITEDVDGIAADEPLLYVIDAVRARKRALEHGETVPEGVWGTLGKILNDFKAVSQIGFNMNMNKDI